MGTENNGNLNKIKERVQKLLNQAADREGTAEGEIFYQKAFDLMASYGFEERDLDNPDAEDEVIHREFAFSGSYTEMQAHLLVGLTNALHCVAFYNGVYGSTRVLSATVFGVKRHVDRIEMLFSLLNPQMAAGARNVGGNPAVSTVVARRSYMQGFSSTIYARLCRAESDVAHDSNRYALALVDDQAKAEDARDAFAAQEGIYLSNRQSKRSLDGEAFFRGAEDGHASDLGQTRVKARPALPC